MWLQNAVITDPGFAHVHQLTRIAAGFLGAEDQQAVLGELRGALGALRTNERASAELYVELAEAAVEKVGRRHPDDVHVKHRRTPCPGRPRGGRRRVHPTSTDGTALARPCAGPPACGRRLPHRPVACLRPQGRSWMGEERARLEKLLRTTDVPGAEAIDMHRMVNVLCDFLGHEGKAAELPPKPAPPQQDEPPMNVHDEF
jgi:hypothetical protein